MYIVASLYGESDYCFSLLVSTASLSVFFLVVLMVSDGVLRDAGKTNPLVEKSFLLSEDCHFIADFSMETLSVFLLYCFPTAISQF
jgi:hypothetical protein